MNFKRRKRKPHKGCCSMCMLQTMRSLHHRIPTRQEVRADEATTSALDPDEYDPHFCDSTCECGGIAEQQIPSDSPLWHQISALKEYQP